MEGLKIGFLHKAFVFQSKQLLCFLIPLLLLLIPMLAFPYWESRMPTMWQALSGFLEAPPFAFLLLNCLIVTIIASSKLESDPVKGHEEESQRESMIPNERGDGKPVSVAENGTLQSHNYQSTEYAYDSILNQGKKFLSSSYSLDANYANQRKQEPIIEKKPTRRSRLAGAATATAYPSSEDMWAAVILSNKSNDDRMQVEKRCNDIVQSQPVAAVAALRPPAAATESVAPAAAPALVTNPRRAGKAASNTPKAPGEALAGGAMVKHEETDHDDEEMYDSELEELNRRAEEFIARFNGQMRLQRQESLKRQKGRRLCSYDVQYAHHHHVQLPVRGLMVG